jgi:hypothetical protein
MILAHIRQENSLPTACERGQVLSQMPPAKPEAWKNMGRSKRLEVIVRFHGYPPNRRLSRYRHSVFECF